MAFRFVRGFSLFHSGIDLSAPRGTPVHAVGGGPVTWAGPASSPGAPGNTRGGGNVVVVRVGEREHHYAHLDTIRASGSVYAGGLIGTVGSTGVATGPHLHFGIWDLRLRRYIDPNTLISTATLIRAVSGSAVGGGSVVPVETAPDLASAVYLDWLERNVRPAIGRSTWEAVFRASGSLDFWNIGNPNNAAVFYVSTLLGYLEPEIPRSATITQADYDRVVAHIRSGTAKDALGLDPLGLGAAASGLAAAAAGIVKGAGQAAILAALAFLGLYLLVRGR